MKITKTKVVNSILVLVLLTPFWMYLAWQFSPKKVMRIIIVDKTVLTKQCTEHESFNWVLKYNKYCKADNEFYSISNDYYGFFPEENGKYETHGMEAMSDSEINELVQKSDMTYYTDTYGIYYNEWFANKNINEKSDLIYGGMSEQDISFLTKMKESKKPVIAEFNSIQSPTKEEIRKKFEGLFNITWSGWVGRYFVDLDTLNNKELPKWLVRNYKDQHGNNWPFKHSGIVFIRNDDHIEILENGIDLNEEVPVIVSSTFGQQEYNLPEQIQYPYWFDVMTTSHSNNVVAEYEIQPTAKGDSIMSKYSILKRFPAVLAHTGNDYSFYYFAGDYADDPISQGSSRFKGMPTVKSFFSASTDKSDRSSFFWKFYVPLISKILKNNYNATNKK